MRRLVSGIALGVVGIVVFASPAAADPVKPTNARSEVTELIPPSDAITVDIVGGDAFLRVRVNAGHEVSISGYEGEPYLRIIGDGTVERNENSPAVYLNTDRYGGSVRPQNADAAAEPDWRKVGSGGTYLWHDHRVHFMGIAQPIERWTVAMVVDGSPVEVVGRLDILAAPNPVWWWLVAAGLGAGVVWLCRGYVHRVTVASAAAVAALVIGLAEMAAVPKAAGGSIAPIIAPLASLVLSALSAVVPKVRQSMLAAAAASLVVGSIARLDTLNHAELLTDVSPSFERLTVAVSLGVGFGLLAVVALGFAGIRFPWLDRPRPGRASSVA